MILVFPAQPFEGAVVDYDFQEQAKAATSAGFSVVTYNLEEGRLFARGHQGRALYRGWMMSPERYVAFYRQLQEQGLELATRPEEYRYAHWLPGWYSALEKWTPESVWFEGRDFDYERLVGAFGSGPLVVKDYVKSLKHYWGEACYIPEVGDEARVREVASRFLELRDEELQGGLVFRRFELFRAWSEDPRSGFPMSVEFRVFAVAGVPMSVLPAWEGLEAAAPPSSLCEELCARVSSPFFSLDLALNLGDDWRVVEVGDGQVSGLGGLVCSKGFYGSLADAW